MTAITRLASIMFALVTTTTGCIGEITGSSTDPIVEDDPVGSGSDDPVIPEPPAPPMTATRFLHESGVKSCDHAFACKANYPTDKGSFDEMYGLTQTACYDMMDLAAGAALVESSIAAARVVFNPTAATSCLTGMVAGDCATFFTPGPTYPTTCSEALLGTVADGDLCAVDHDCLNSDSVCDLATTVCTANGIGDPGDDQP